MKFILLLIELYKVFIYFHIHTFPYMPDISVVNVFSHSVDYLQIFNDNFFHRAQAYLFDIVLFVCCGIILLVFGIESLKISPRLVFMSILLLSSYIFYSLRSYI